MRTNASASEMSRICSPMVRKSSLIVLWSDAFLYSTRHGTLDLTSTPVFTELPVNPGQGEKLSFNLVVDLGLCPL